MRCASRGHPADRRRYSREYGITLRDVYGAGDLFSRKRYGCGLAITHRYILRLGALIGRVEVAAADARLGCEMFVARCTIWSGSALWFGRRYRLCKIQPRDVRRNGALLLGMRYSRWNTVKLRDIPTTTYCLD